MGRNLAILFLAVVLVSAGRLTAGGVVGRTEARRARRHRPLSDGFILTGIDGELVGDKNGKWFFTFDSELRGNRGHITAGTNIEMLPSSGLEKMVANLKEHSDAGYRIWGRVTKYKGKNFIFPVYFLPIAQIERVTEPNEPNRPQQAAVTAINDPDDALAIPEKVITRLQSKRIVRVEQLKKGLELKADSILADRSGFISQRADGEFVYTLDALGRNIQQFSLSLLPCYILESAERKQTDQLEPMRFKVAGIVTRYEGQNWLLLQRALPVYSHGNFGR